MFSGLTGRGRPLILAARGARKQQGEAVMSLRTQIVVASAMLSVGVMAGAQANGSAALTSRFFGTWQEDVSKRTVGSSPSLRFRRSANGGIEELRGPEL